MDSNIQILCRFQKCKRKVPPLSLLSTQKLPFTTKKMSLLIPFGQRESIMKRKSKLAPTYLGISLMMSII